MRWGVVSDVSDGGEEIFGDEYRGDDARGGGDEGGGRERGVERIFGVVCDVGSGDGGGMVYVRGV